jgi:polysaccharide pyruvyl transferase WcaK-like protein
VRILVDHSGYALLNVGDIAMLQVCVRRLEQLWPQASIGVIGESPDRLARYCPQANQVASSIVGRKGAWVLPRRGQLAAEQAWKTGAPLVARRAMTHTAAPDLPWPGGKRLLDAIRQADIVVSSGGGFINDVWWWHGAGVLSVLSMAQRLGKPTAMFGQGIGPLTHPLLQRHVRSTMPRLSIVGLREGVMSPALLQTHGVAEAQLIVTGDDALELATPVRPRTGNAVGINVRVAGYTGVDAKMAQQVVAVVREAARRWKAPIIALPVSRYEADSDLRAMKGHLAIRGTDDLDNGVDDIESPLQLASAARRCRMVVTGSYHAAVFALASGVPAVCVCMSLYYEAKFKGLSRLFPGACRVVSGEHCLGGELASVVDWAWQEGEGNRDSAHAAALAQVRRSRMTYEAFKRCLENASPPRVSAA